MASSAGSPTRIVGTKRRAIASASASRSAGTSIRVGELQDCPQLPKQALMPAGTAFSKSASGSRMFGDLPPSSCATRLIVSAAALATATPPRVDPVKDTMSTCGCDDSAAPASGPSPLTRLKTPGGTPARSITSASRSALSGDNSLGFRTTVQPAASAGAIFSAAWCSGQFHGVMRPQTPIASRTITALPCGCVNSTCSSMSA